MSDLSASRKLAKAYQFYSDERGAMSGDIQMLCDRIEELEATNNKLIKRIRESISDAAKNADENSYGTHAEALREYLDIFDNDFRVVR